MRPLALLLFAGCATVPHAPGSGGMPGAGLSSGSFSASMLGPGATAPNDGVALIVGTSANVDRSISFDPDNTAIGLNYNPNTGVWTLTGLGAVVFSGITRIQGTLLSSNTGDTSNGSGLAMAVPSLQFAVANSGADTTEDNLMSYSLPAGAMGTNGRGVRVTAWGDGVSTADVTTAKCYFGATVAATKVLTASQANTWRAVYEVLRTGAATQISTGVVENGGTAATVTHTNAAPTETLSGAVTIKCTGQRTVSSVANSVRQLGMMVEFIN